MPKYEKFASLIREAVNFDNIDYNTLGVAADWLEDHEEMEKAACIRWLIENKKRPSYYDNKQHHFYVRTYANSTDFLPASLFYSSKVNDDVFSRKDVFALYVEVILSWEIKKLMNKDSFYQILH